MVVAISEVKWDPLGLATFFMNSRAGRLEWVSL